METVLAQHRLAGLLAERPWWQQQSHSLLLRMTAPDRTAAMALLAAIRACVPDQGATSVCTELRGVDLRVQVRCSGHVGVTDAAIALLRDIDTATAALRPGDPLHGPPTSDQGRGVNAVDRLLTAHGRPRNS